MRKMSCFSPLKCRDRGGTDGAKLEGTSPGVHTPGPPCTSREVFVYQHPPHPYSPGPGSGGQWVTRGDPKGTQGPEDPAPPTALGRGFAPQTPGHAPAAAPTWRAGSSSSVLVLAPGCRETPCSGPPDPPVPPLGWPQGILCQLPRLGG